MEATILNALINNVKLTLTPVGGLTKISMIKEIKLTNGRTAKAAYRPTLITKNLTTELPKVYATFIDYCKKQES